MSAHRMFESPDEFIKRLKELREERDKNRKKHSGIARRKVLSPAERESIFKSTAGTCHLCGGRFEDDENWQADHVFSKAMGGGNGIENYLPAHAICNGYRKAYHAEEFQWILKLGVWLRTQIQKETGLGQRAAEKFLAHERTRDGRRKK